MTDAERNYACAAIFDTKNYDPDSLRAVASIVVDLAAKPAPRTITLLGPTCGLCGGLLNSAVNPKPDMHSTDCPWRRAEVLVERMLP